MEIFAKIVTRWKLITIFAKIPILDVQLGSEYTSGSILKTMSHIVSKVYETCSASKIS